MSKRKCIWICIILVTIMFLSNIRTTYSVDLNSLLSKENDIQSKLDNAKKELKKIDAEKSEVEKQLNQLNAQISIYQSEIDLLQVKIDENEAKLVELEADYEARSKTLAKRIVAQYETGDITYLDFLLTSESLTDFISNYYMLGEIAQMDVTMLNKIQNTKSEIEQIKQQLAEDKSNLEVQNNTLKAKKSERETYKNQLSQDEKDLQARREEYDKELKSVESEIKKLQSNLAYMGGGIMAWPVPNWPISSTPGNLFGYRWHPIFHDWRKHTGVDIAAPTGAKFVAAESGKVIVASGSFGGYGETVIIDHGGGITTLYGHCSALYVSVGQYVTKGTVISAVGSSGNSTGPHAHFEVRKNGTPVDPLPYIKK